MQPPAPSVESEPKRPPFVRFSIVGTIIAYGISFFTAKLTSPPSLGPRSMASFSAEALGGMAVAIGAGAILASLVGAVLLLGKYRFLRVFTLTYAFMVILVPVTRLREIHPSTRTAAQKAAEESATEEHEIKEALKNQLASQAHDALSNPARKRTQIEAPPPISSLRSEDSKIDALILAILADFLGGLDRLYNSIDQFGTHNILNAEHLLADQTLAESYKMLDQVRSSIEKCRASTMRSVLRASERVKTSGLSDKAQGEVMKIMTKFFEDFLPVVEEICKLEAEIVAVSQETLDFLRAKKGSWTVEESRIQFATDADSETYNSFLDKMSKCEDRKLEIKKELIRKDQALAQ